MTWNIPLSEEYILIEKEFIEKEHRLPDFHELIVFQRSRQITAINNCSVCGDKPKISKGLSKYFFIQCDSDRHLITSDADISLDVAIKNWNSGKIFVHSKNI